MVDAGLIGQANLFRVRCDLPLVGCRDTLLLPLAPASSHTKRLLLSPRPPDPPLRLPPEYLAASRSSRLNRRCCSFSSSWEKPLSAAVRPGRALAVAQVAVPI